MTNHVSAFMLLRTTGHTVEAGVAEAEQRVRDVGLCPVTDVLVQGDLDLEVDGTHSYHVVGLLGSADHVNAVLRHNHTLTTIDQD
jgi:hypothetical protein